MATYHRRAARTGVLGGTDIVVGASTVRVEEEAFEVNPG
jgi:hypothetical protein